MFVCGNTGTPTAADIGMTVQMDITADNGWQPDDVQSFQIDVRGVPPQITSTLPALTVTVGQTWSYTITGTGEPAPAVGGNPAWLTLTGNTLSGSPTGSDLGMSGNITVTLPNGWLPDATQAFQILHDHQRPVVSQPIVARWLPFGERHGT